MKIFARLTGGNTSVGSASTSGGGGGGGLSTATAGTSAGGTTTSSSSNRKNAGNKDKVIDSSATSSKIHASENQAILKGSDDGIGGSDDSKLLILTTSNGLETALVPPPLQPIEVDLINKILPRELLIRVFSYLDVVDLCRCAQVSKVKRNKKLSIKKYFYFYLDVFFFVNKKIKSWNALALDGSNWQYIDLLDFQKDVNTIVLENIAKRSNEFLKAIRLENCQSIQDEAIRYVFIFVNRK